MLLWYREKNLFDLFVCCWEFHCGAKEPIFEAAKQLNSTMHALMHWHELWFPCHMKQANQLVANMREACACFKILSLALEEVFIRLTLFIGTMQRDNVFPFGQTDLLKTLLETA
jgi:hypothetical protein